MINTRMRSYEYSDYNSLDEYGQLTAKDDSFYFETEDGDAIVLEGEEEIYLMAEGKDTKTIVMSISVLSQNSQDNVLYNGATYVGLTQSNISDDAVIYYNDRKLKVTYVNNSTRLKQVYLKEI